MTAASAVALVAALLATIIAVVVPLVTFRLALRQDEMRWLRERRADLYVDLLTEGVAEREWLQHALADEETQKRAAQYFKDVRLPPLDRARLGARAAIVGSRRVNGLFNDLTREAGQALLNTDRLDPEALQMRTRVRVGQIVDDLEAAVRRELGADRIPLEPGEGQPNHGQS